MFKRVFKKGLITVLLVGLMAVPAMASDLVFDNVSGTGASATSVSGQGPWQSAQFTFTNVSALTFTVEGSNNSGDNWTTLATKALTLAEIAAGEVAVSLIDMPRDLVRHNVTVLTEAGSSSISSRHLTVYPSRR